jgi:hypothetical protein
MSTEYYTHSGEPATAADLSSSNMRAEFQLIEDAFGKFPVMSTNQSKLLGVNSGGTAIEALTAAAAIALLAGAVAAFSVDDAVNNDVTNVATLTHTTSGSPAAGIGTGLAFITETTAGNETGMVIEAVTTDVGSGVEDFDLVVKLMEGGAAAAEKLRLTSAGNLQMGDGDEIQLGASQDLAIYHNGTNSYIRDTGTGALRITGDIRFANSGDTGLTLSSDGTALYLYHNNSLRAQTTAAGVSFSGDLLFTQADPEILGGDTDGELYISPSTSVALGGNIMLYGDTHASDADSIRLRLGTTTYFMVDGPNSKNS